MPPMDVEPKVAGVDTCARSARDAGEPQAGTAPRARGWVLVEQPGSWPPDAHDALDGRVPPPSELEGVRVQLVRRPGPHPSSVEGPRRVILAHAGPSPWMEDLGVVSPGDLAQIPFAAAGHVSAPGAGARISTPLFLVCTHGNRDRCCAEMGRPIAAALADRHGDAVWETSHVGGHRFAGNLVVLPDGLVYGGLVADRAIAVAGGHLHGRIDLDHLRGRSSFDPVQQATEVLVRRELDLDDAVPLRIGPASGDGDRHRIEVAVAGERMAATIERRPLGRAFRLACDREEIEDPGRYVLTALSAVADDR